MKYRITAHSKGTILSKESLKALEPTKPHKFGGGIVIITPDGEMIKHSEDT